jgi:polar amino acid transport system substrate-binding protein
MRFKLFYLMFALVFILKGYAENISIVTMEWPPFTDSKVKNLGTTTDVVIKAFKNQGVQAKVVFTNWTRALEATESGEFSAIFPAYYSKERESNFYFSNKTSSIQVGFIKLKENNISYHFTGNNFNEVYDEFKKQNLKIGVVKSYINEDNFDKRTDLNKIEYGSETQALTALLNKKIDVYFADNVVYKEYLKKNFRDNINLAEFLEPAILDKSLFLLFPKSQKNSLELKEKFNTGLKQILSSTP